MIVEIVRTGPTPQPQEGEAVTFARRKPEQSRIENIDGMTKLYDHIRMLDADGYPKAFVESDGFRFEFSRASLKHGRIIADVEITEVSDE
jgi:methionyl-tRNA formyltransferase